MHHIRNTSLENPFIPFQRMFFAYNYLDIGGKKYLEAISGKPGYRNKKYTVG